MKFLIGLINRKYYKVLGCEANMNETLILNQLNNMKVEITKLREEMNDFILTKDDLSSLEEADKDFLNGDAISHEQLKKELEL